MGPQSKHVFVVKDEGTSICACGVKLIGKRYVDRFYIDAEGNKSNKPPHCSLHFKTPVIETMWTANEAKKIEAVAFIYSVYDKILKDTLFEPTDNKWELKLSAETILKSNGVTI